MQLIRCTAKLQKEMGLKKSDLVEDEPKFSYLGSWHSNLIYINRSKCVLFMNDKTLFNFIVAGVSRAEIKELSSMFIENLHSIPADEGFDQSTINKIRSEYDEIGYAKNKQQKRSGINE